jgi:hypothetical protein
MSFGHLWASIIEEYSRLTLTFEKDRLPALSGIARLANHFCPGRYVAGLWEKDLPRQLLWYRGWEQGHGIEMPDTTTSRQRATVYAPTFSWTSWVEQVTYTYENTTSACEVVGITVALSGDNLYSQISYANIQLRGEIVPVVPFRFRILLLKSELMRDRGESILSRYPSDYPSLKLDYNVDEYWHQLFFLKMAKGGGGKAHFHGLILRKTGLTELYTRVGIGTNIPTSRMSHYECASTVQIV